MPAVREPVIGVRAGVWYVAVEGQVFLVTHDIEAAVKYAKSWSLRENARYAVT